MQIHFRFTASMLLKLSYCTSLLLAPVSYANNETLLNIYELARNNDHQLKADYAEYQASKENAAISQSTFLPQVSATAGVSQNDSDSTTNNKVTSNTSTDHSDIDGTEYNIRLTQPLIDFNAWNTYKRGKTLKRIAEINYQAAEQSLIIRTAQSYFDILRAFDQLDTSKAEEKAQATLLEQTRQRYEVGLISITDVYEIQAAYDSAVANRINAEASLGIQQDVLSVLTGRIHTHIAPLKKDFSAQPPTPDDKKSWVDFANTNNLALRASELSAESARSAAKAAKGNRLPKLEANISYGHSDLDTDSSANDNNNTDTDTTRLSIDLTIPLYTGGNLSATQRQAEYSSVQARETFLLTQRQTIQNTRSLFLRVSTDIAQIKARKQAILSNESSLDATRAGYNAGTRNIVDVVDAQRDLFQAQRDYFDTLYNYIINTLALKQSAGNLTVSDLETLEKSLTTH